MKLVRGAPGATRVTGQQAAGPELIAKGGKQPGTTDVQAPTLTTGQVRIPAGKLLPEGLSRDAAFSKETAERLRAYVESADLYTISELPKDVIAGFSALLKPELGGLLSSRPVPGLFANPFSMAKLLQADAKTAAAIEQYFAPRFAFEPPEVKRQVLEDIEPVLKKGEKAMLEAFHLPLDFLGDPARGPITASLESEGKHQLNPGILDYYGPNPEGLLDPQALTPEALHFYTKKDSLLLSPERKLGPAFQRLSHADQLASLRWRDLTPLGRLTYLTHYKNHVDPKVRLVRLEPGAMSGTAPPPPTLRDELKWERLGPLTTWEVVTKTHYTSEDQIWCDAEFARRVHADGTSGFHIHSVVRLETPEEVSRLGPPLLGYFALEDLCLFASGATNGTSLLEHSMLRVWKAEPLGILAKSLRDDGRLSMGPFWEAKLHCVGARVGIYDEPDKLGGELRGMSRSPAQQARYTRRVRLALHRGAFLDLPPPPWPGWNAGDPALPDRAWKAAQVKGAEVPFSELLKLVSTEREEHDPYRLASPLWAFEALPGFPAAKRAVIDKERQGFVAELARLSAVVTASCRAHRRVDAGQLREHVKDAVRTFFRNTELLATLEQMAVRLVKGRIK